MDNLKYCHSYSIDKKDMDSNGNPGRAVHTYNNNFLVTYDCRTSQFTYPINANMYFAADFDERPLWQIMAEDGLMAENTAEMLHEKITEVAGAASPMACFTECFIKNSGQLPGWYMVGFICPVPGKVISITFTYIDNEIAANRSLEQKADYDELTGLLSGEAFCRYVDQKIKCDGDGIGAEEYAIVFFDIFRFKAINDIFGIAEGDRLLVHIADVIAQSVKHQDIVARMGSDHFVFCTHAKGEELEELIERVHDGISQYSLPYQITCSAGIYVIKDKCMRVDAMIDRAILAQASIKGSYTIKYKYYHESLRNAMLSEQEITGSMIAALHKEQFVVYYQPQYNHSTGMLVGAEALVRWNHPEKGVISPGIFIPIFEKNGFITKLDLHVFEQACRFLHACKEKGLPLVPVSTNFSRYDIFQPDFVERLEEIRSRYDVSPGNLRAEITESAIMGSSQQTNEVIRKLHEQGYLVEMDDFGSGYSSLNVLKDIELDIIKLDMMFLENRSVSGRGGTILSSVVRMARWLGLPVIAEGVETENQADFLRSIGCEYIQGYLYSRPLPREKYEELLGSSAIGTKLHQTNLIDTLNAANFWDPQSQETLIFNNYVGGAAIFEYYDNKIEILRVNKKYLQEIGMNLSEKEVISCDLLSCFDDSNRNVFLNMLERAIETAEEQECETWRHLTSSCCGDERICIRCTVRMIGKKEDVCMFYAMIRNITAEKEQFMTAMDNERRFKMASEQINIYYWEYTVATREMRPCYRCMRDLGLPALMKNYPDSAIEMGIFPPEVAEMYRDWHRQIAAGVRQLEAVIPLTAGRIPFRVRYTTEFDENGKPVKAYGSAALEV